MVKFFSKKIYSAKWILFTITLLFLSFSSFSQECPNPATGTIASDCIASDDFVVNGGTLTISNGVTVTVTSNFIIQGSAVVIATGAEINIGGEFRGQFGAGTPNTITGGDFNTSGNILNGQGGILQLDNVEFSTAANFINSSPVVVSNGSLVQTSGNFINNSSFTVTGSSLTVGGNFLNQNGANLTVDGGGSTTVGGNFDNIGGSATAGNSGGVISVGGNFANNNGGGVSTNGGAVVVNGSFSGTAPTGDGEGCDTSMGGCCGGTAICGALPVTLLDFNAKLIDGNAVLNWQTASEEDNEFFTIYKSVDGIIFNELTTVLGNGTTSELSNYNYTDRNIVGGNVFYRLGQTDYDGSNEILRTVFLEVNQIDQGLIAYPSQIKIGEDLNLKNILGTVSSFDIQLISTDGKTINNLKIEEHVNGLLLKVSELSISSGIYILKGRVNLQEISVKIIISE